MLYIRGHKIIKGYIGNTPISHVGFGKSGLIKIKSENGGSDYPNNLIAKYTTNASGVLPVFNDGYQYTVNETEANGIYTVEISSDSDFTSCSFNGKKELLTVDYLKVTDKVTTMSNMFRNCSQLTQLDVSNWDTSQVTNIDLMFARCSQLTQLDVSKWDTSQVQYMNGMFEDCSQLTQLDLSNWDTTNVINMSGMFNKCSQFTQLDISKWNISNVKYMHYMFARCTQLTQLDLSNWVISKVASMQYMFENCSKLTQLDLSNWDTSKVASMQSMFENCTSLTDFIAPKNINVNTSFNYCNNLSHDSLMSIVNNLATVTSTKTLILGSTNLAKLSSEEKAIATNKGWTLA